jgi:signal transduction histidine kinase
MEISKESGSILHSREIGDLAFAVFFGILASLFGHIYFCVPDYPFAFTDLREIPLIIAVIYIRNPLYIILSCMLSAIQLTNQLPFLPTAVMHVVPVIVVWGAYQFIKTKKMKHLQRGLLWALIMVVYYYVFLFPSFVITFECFGLNDGKSFFTHLSYLIAATKYELTSTVLVTSLYVVKIDAEKQLAYANKNLEALIGQRTAELKQVNEELTKLNDILFESNTDLEKKVAERTEKIRLQLIQLNTYAYMNSHEVRGPLARIMGLSILLKQEKDPDEQTFLAEKILFSCEELDEIIQRMNLLLQSDKE